MGAEISSLTQKIENELHQQDIELLGQQTEFLYTENQSMKQQIIDRNDLIIPNDS